MPLNCIIILCVHVFWPSSVAIWLSSCFPVELNGLARVSYKTCAFLQERVLFLGFVGSCKILVRCKGPFLAIMCKSCKIVSTGFTYTINQIIVIS